MNEKIKELILNFTHTESSDWTITKLHGDASYRTYYRASRKNGESFIVMEMPDGKSSVSEEITNYEGEKKELPYLNVQRYFLNSSLPAPRLIHKSKDEKLLMIEDLGDSLFFKQVNGQPIPVQDQWYLRAIDLLINIQRSASNDDNCIAFKRSFDSRLLNWEFDHFLEYGIEVRLGKKVSDEDKEKFMRMSRKISSQIENLPYCFTHRDFQSRNLIDHNNKLYIIDFQDALMGPFVYDLVSLLRDSYILLKHDQIKSLIQYYCEKTGRDINQTMRAFHLVTVQRKLKDAGRFVYIDKVKGNPNYLKNIPTSLEYVKSALSNLPEEQEFYNFLNNHIPEWNT